MLLESITTYVDSLSKSEKKVALAILANPQAVVTGNITALAKKAQVSEPTVVRFCRSLGYDGWHDFKLRLAQSMAIALPGANESMAQEDLATDLIDKICSRSINALLGLRNQLAPQAIERALDVLTHSNRIELYGQGTSGIVATDAQHKFFRAGVSSMAYTDPHIHGIAAGLLGPSDTVIAISQRGNGIALLRSVALARKGGADVIVLAPGGTPLAALATLLLPVNLSVHSDPYTPISERLAHLVVIDILAVGLALRRGPEFRTKMQLAENSLDDHDIRFDASSR